MDEKLESEQRKVFEGKVPHAFDFLHWWYIPLGNESEINELDSPRQRTGHGLSCFLSLSKVRRFHGEPLVSRNSDI